MSEQLNAFQAAEWLEISHDDFVVALNRREVPRPQRDGLTLYWTREQIEAFLVRRLYVPLEIEISPESAERMAAMLKTICPGIKAPSIHLVPGRDDDV